MKEYEVSITIRNNLLKERRLEKGLTVSAFAALVEINRNTYGALECLRLSPLKQRAPRRPLEKVWRECVYKLARFYEVRPEVLFPQDFEKLKTNKYIAKVNTDEIRALSLSDRTPKYLPQTIDSPEKLYEKNELINITGQVIDTLNSQEKLVLKLKLGLEGEDPQSNEMVAHILGVGKKRVCQIQNNAYRKLRHPHRIKRLQPFLED